MRALSTVFFLSAALSACGNYHAPSAQQQQDARQAIPALLTGVAQSRRDEGAVVALRWDVKNISLTADQWSWTEIEVIARSDADRAEAVTTRWTVSVDPAALASDIPASISRQAWGMNLVCEERDCVRRKGIRTTVVDGERTEEPLPPETVGRAEWLFEDYETRDRATMLVRRALGFPPR